MSLNGGEAEDTHGECEWTNKTAIQLVTTFRISVAHITTFPGCEICFLCNARPKCERIVRIHCSSSSKSMQRENERKRKWFYKSFFSLLLLLLRVCGAVGFGPNRNDVSKMNNLISSASSFSGQTVPTASLECSMCVSAVGRYTVVWLV